MGFGQIFQVLGKLYQILESESKPFLCKQTKTIPKAIIAPNSAAVMSNSYFTFQNAIKALSRAQRTVHPVGAGPSESDFWPSGLWSPGLTDDQNGHKD